MLASPTEAFRAAAFLVAFVDGTGSGDAFAAGFLAGQLRGMDVNDSLALANRCGGSAMLVQADQEGLPRWEEVVSTARWRGDVNR